MRKEVTRKGNNKTIMLLSLLTFFYFGTLILLNELKVDATSIGFFRELLTLPFLILLVTLLVLTIKAFIKERYSRRSFAFYALVLMLLTITLLVVFW